MKNRIVLLFGMLLSVMSVVAQTPREVVQQDKEKFNFWESPNTMIIVVILILVLFISRRWSSRVLKKRDDTINKDKDRL